MCLSSDKGRLLCWELVATGDWRLSLGTDVFDYPLLDQRSVFNYCANCDIPVSHLQNEEASVLCLCWVSSQPSVKVLSFFLVVFFF